MCLHAPFHEISADHNLAMQVLSIKHPLRYNGTYETNKHVPCAYVVMDVPTAMVLQKAPPW